MGQICNTTKEQNINNSKIVKDTTNQIDQSREEARLILASYRQCKVVRKVQKVNQLVITGFGEQFPKEEIPDPPTKVGHSKSQQINELIDKMSSDNLIHENDNISRSDGHALQFN